MNKIRNKVQLIGNVGSKPNIEQTKNGLVYTKISLATNEFKYDGDGEKIQHTLWHQVIAWNKLAKKVNQYVQKGQEICINGKLNHRTYEDLDGKKQYVTEVIADEVLFLKKQFLNVFKGPTEVGPKDYFCNTLFINSSHEN